MSGEQKSIDGVSKAISAETLDLSKRKPVSAEDQTKKAAADFEALLLHQMFQSMWQGGLGGDMFASNEEEMYRDMLTDAVAKSVAEKQSLGMSELFVKEMQKRSIK